MDIKDTFRSQNKPLVLDGAMGAYLTSHGVNWDTNLWSSYANVSTPEIVLDLHKEYLKAGADIITTNTFRTNPIAVNNSNLQVDYKDFVRKSVEIALHAVAGYENRIVAGSNAPAEDCYQKDRTISTYLLNDNHKKHIDELYSAGCHAILNETHSHLDEIEIICKYCNSQNIPFIMSLFITENMTILSGEPVSEVVNHIKSYNPLAIGFNCIFPKEFEKYYLNHIPDFPWGIYLNCGAGNYTDHNISCGITSEGYVETIREFVNKELKFVGSCCGSTPLHTLAIRRFVDEIY